MLNSYGEYLSLKDSSNKQYSLPKRDDAVSKWRTGWFKNHLQPSGDTQGLVEGTSFPLPHYFPYSFSRKHLLSLPFSWFLPTHLPTYFICLLKLSLLLSPWQKLLWKTMVQCWSLGQTQTPRWKQLHGGEPTRACGGTLFSHYPLLHTVSYW